MRWAMRYISKLLHFCRASRRLSRHYLQPRKTPHISRWLVVDDTTFLHRLAIFNLQFCISEYHQVLVLPVNARDIELIEQPYPTHHLHYIGQWNNFGLPLGTRRCQWRWITVATTSCAQRVMFYITQLMIYLTTWIGLPQKAEISGMIWSRVPH